jgi:hypothetical protein
MKRLIIFLSGVLVILLLVLFFVSQRRLLSNVSPVTVPTLLSPTKSLIKVPTQYPEYLLPKPDRIAPDEDPNAYEKLPKSDQEFSSLVTTLPIKTNDYGVDFNFSNSSFIVVILSDKGMEDYKELREKYPNLKDTLFTVVDKHKAQQSPR